MSYRITNISSTPFSDISPGKSKIVETEKEVQYYQKFIDTGLLSVQEVGKRERVPESAISSSTETKDNGALGKSEEMEIEENG